MHTTYIKQGYLLLVLILSIMACNTPREKQEIGINKEFLSFPTPELMPVNSQVQMIESDSGNYLLSYNYFNKTYQFLEFPSGILRYEIPLQFEGPNSVRGFAGGTVASLDSFWLLTQPPAISLMDFGGEVFLKKKIENSLLSIAFIDTAQDKPLFQYGSKIFGAQPLFMGHHDISKTDIKKHQLLYSYDFIKDTVQWYDVFYPDDFWDQGKKISGFSWAQREEKIYMAPFHDHEVQVFDMCSGKVVEKKQVKSDQVNQFHFLNEIPGSRTEGLLSRIAYDRYGPLIYDKYRDVFYRIFLPAVKLEKDYSDEELNTLNYNRPFAGVTVLDKDLNILTEYMFDEHEVVTEYNFFVGEKGLYLSMNNLLHPDYNEDEFRYLVFDF